MFEATDEKDVGIALQFFVMECILMRQKKIAVITWAHTVGQGRRDRMAAGTAEP